MCWVSWFGRCIVGDLCFDLWFAVMCLLFGYCIAVDCLVLIVLLFVSILYRGNHWLCALCFLCLGCWWLLVFVGC